MIAFPHILIVEDNEDIYKATLRNLRRAHLVNPISWCAGARQALDFLRYEGEFAGRAESQADLMLIDLNLRGMDGRELIGILKKDEELKSIPIFALSSSREERDLRHCRSLGADGCIEKPVDFNGLAEAVRTMSGGWFGIALLPQTRTPPAREA